MHAVFTWPVGRDAARRPASPAPVLAYVAGSFVGGVVTGLILGVLGATLASVGVTHVSVLAALAPLVAVAVVGQLNGTVAPLPERRAQVPERWLLWRHQTLVALAFGTMIGAGLLTRLSHAVAWCLAVLALGAPRIEVALALGAVYGVARALPLVITWLQDRRGHPRADWIALTGPRSALAQMLAVVAVATYGSALALLT